MPRGRGLVKVKKVMAKNSPEDQAMLNSMFAQMTGSEHADPEVIIPKIRQLYTFIQKYIKIYKLFLGFDEFINNFDECKEEFAQIQRFVEKIEKSVDKLNVDVLESMDKEKVNDLYMSFKDLKVIRSIVVTSGNFKKYDNYLSDPDNLRDDFIKREPGLIFTPIDFTDLDLKKLWVSEKLTKMAKKFILNILSHTYKIGHSIYKIITSPNVDIKKFSCVLIDNIDAMKKQIPRCDKAFDIIAQSVSMLENNFDGYYKTSVEAENPSIIIESFIVDVSMNQKSSASITTQFRKIIMFMKRKSANNNDPRVAKLFKMLNNQYNMMEQKTGVEPASSDSDSDYEDEEKSKVEAKEDEVADSKKRK